MVPNRDHDKEGNVPGTGQPSKKPPNRGTRPPEPAIPQMGKLVDEDIPETLAQLLLSAESRGESLMQWIKDAKMAKRRMRRLAESL